MPIKDFGISNGHGRNQPGLMPTGRQGNLIVTSSQTDITLPVIVQVTGEPAANNLQLAPFLLGNPPSVLNVVTNTVETSGQIGDPDSMTLDPAGELVLDNRSDDSLYIVNPSVAGPVRRVPLTLNGSPVEVNESASTHTQAEPQFVPANRSVRK